MDEKILKQAKTVFKNLCERLDELDWHYEKDEEEMKIDSMAQGEDLPIEVRIRVNAENQIVSVLSQMPYVIPVNRRAALAIAISQANNGMVDGNFEMDFASGKILFRLTASYRESLIGKGLFTYLLSCACYTVQEYNDKFLMVSKKDMSVEEILKYIE